MIKEMYFRTNINHSLPTYRVIKKNFDDMFGEDAEMLVALLVAEQTGAGYLQNNL